MHIDLTAEETAALARELTDITWSDRYPLSPRIKVLEGIRAKLRPQPVRPAASPSPRVYEPPSKGAVSEATLAIPRLSRRECFC
jgi:hypothetical protein